MNEPPNVRFKIFRVYSLPDAQRLKQVLICSQHGTQLWILTFIHNINLCMYVCFTIKCIHVKVHLKLALFSKNCHFCWQSYELFATKWSKQTIACSNKLIGKTEIVFYKEFISQFVAVIDVAVSLSLFEILVEKKVLRIKKKYILARLILLSDIIKLY